MNFSTMGDVAFVYKKIKKNTASILRAFEQDSSVLYNALGERGNEPAPITLKIYLEDGKLRFEQTDITHKYLGAEKEVARAPKTTRSIPRLSTPARQKLAYA